MAQRPRQQTRLKNTRPSNPGKVATPKPDVAVQTPDKPDDPVSVIAAALHGVMLAVHNVEKTGVNEFHNYEYASESDYLDRIRPEMLKQGLLMIPNLASMSDIDNHGNIFVKVEYTLLHRSGAVWPHKIIAGGAGNDRAKGSVGDKGLYKALTGANKYFLGKLFQISTGDDPEIHTEGQYEKKGEPEKTANGKSTLADQKQDPHEMTQAEWVAGMEKLGEQVKRAKTAAEVNKVMTTDSAIKLLALCSDKGRAKARNTAAERYKTLREAEQNALDSAKADVQRLREGETGNEESGGEFDEDMPLA